MKKINIKYLLLIPIITFSILALLNIRPVAEPSGPPQNIPVNENISVSPTETTYLLIVLNGQLLLRSYNEKGELTEQKPIQYIDIYSLYSDQLSQLQKGIFFESAEAVAQYIQDLGS